MISLLSTQRANCRQTSKLSKVTGKLSLRARRRLPRMSTGRGIVLAGRKLQSRSKTWRPDSSNGKNIAYLKDIDAYAFGEAGVISILRDFFPDEADKEITSKHETTGHKSSTLKQVMTEVEKIIQREKDRKASRKDRKSVGGKKIALAGEGTHHPDDDTQYGGFIMTAKRVREDVDEEEDRQTKHRPDAIPEASTEKGKRLQGR